jgi:hypothetical protein
MWELLESSHYDIILTRLRTTMVHTFSTQYWVAIPKEPRRILPVLVHEVHWTGEAGTKVVSRLFVWWGCLDKYTSLSVCRLLETRIEYEL